MRFSMLAAIAFAISALLLQPFAAQAAPIPPVADDELEAVYSLAGEHRAELEALVGEFATQPLGEPAARFLVANLPLADIGAAEYELLRANIELALDVRYALPYTQSYDDATWAHYVLPHRVSQEPLEPWREVMYRELMPLAEQCDSLQEAALVAKEWAWARMRFVQTERRDQGPLTTIKGGYGRCEELMTVEICALRAVGVPARGVYTPWWPHTDSNHAWTEVLMDDGRWYPAGQVKAEPLPGGDWASGVARQAAIVAGMCYGLPGEAGPDVLTLGTEPGARYARYNVTGNYRELAEVRLELPLPVSKADSHTEPALAATGSWVSVQVFNYGVLREVARVALDDEFGCTLMLGPGRYVLSSNLEGLPAGLRVLDVMQPGEYSLSWLALPYAGAEFVLATGE